MMTTPCLISAMTTSGQGVCSLYIMVNILLVFSSKSMLKPAYVWLTSLLCKHIAPNMYEQLIRLMLGEFPQLHHS